MATVLVVEDDAANAQMVVAMLGRAGHRAIVAADGASGLDRARTDNPDVILLDVSLVGGMSGLDVCRTLRSEPATARTPIMMLSGWAFRSDLEAGLAAGANDYLPKPFNQAELLGRLQPLLEPAGQVPSDTSGNRYRT
jgi:DNA-binding response OmpR family regulator